MLQAAMFRQAFREIKAAWDESRGRSTADTEQHWDQGAAACGSARAGTIEPWRVTRYSPTSSACAVHPMATSPTLMRKWAAGDGHCC